MGEILVIGAHPDDIELHCGGSLLNMWHKNKIISFICSSDRKRKGEALKSFELLKGSKIVFGNLKDGNIIQNKKLIDMIRDLIDRYKINQILTHWIGDYHQDHRAVAYATQAACRGKKLWLWQYSDNSFMFLNDSFNVTVDIEDVMEEKRELLDCFKSQKDKFYIKEAKKSTKEFFKVSANL